MFQDCPDSKVHGAIMGPTWGRQDPCGHHVGPMNLAMRACFNNIMAIVRLPQSQWSNPGRYGWNRVCNTYGYLLRCSWHDKGLVHHRIPEERSYTLHKMIKLITHTKTNFWPNVRHWLHIFFVLTAAIFINTGATQGRKFRSNDTVLRFSSAYHTLTCCCVIASKYPLSQVFESTTFSYIILYIAASFVCEEDLGKFEYMLYTCMPHQQILKTYQSLHNKEFKW